MIQPTRTEALFERLIFNEQGELIGTAEAEVVVAVDDAGLTTYEYDHIDNTYVVLEPLPPMHKLKFVNGNVVEGKPQWEIDEEEKLLALQPSAEEQAKAVFEINLIDRLIDYGLL